MPFSDAPFRRKSPARSAKPAQRSPAGFTLIEILAGVSIIVLLAALLLPTLGRMKTLGNEAKGIANLRQVGVAVLGYANENSSRLPGPVPLGILPYYSKAGSGSSYAFGAQIAPYLGLPDSGPTRQDLVFVPVLQDPAFMEIIRNPSSTTPPFVQNPVLSDQPGVAGKIHIFGVQSTATPQAPLTLSDVAKIGGPSKVWTLMNLDQQLPSSVTNKSGWVSSLPATPAYGKVRLRLFVDAHVETVPLDAPLP